MNVIIYVIFLITIIILFSYETINLKFIAYTISHPVSRTNIRMKEDMFKPDRSNKYTNSSIFNSIIDFPMC